VAAVGTALITIFADATEVQPVAVSVTVKLCVVDTAKPVSVVVVPLPAIAPGFIVHAPAGNPLKATLPVGTAQVGWVMVPTIGVAAVGTALITTLALAAEIQPVAVSVTVKLNVVEGASNVNVVVAPLPAIAPGFIVHAPAGKPLSATLPVGTVQVGCVMVPTIGVAAVGTALITTFAEAAEIQPVAVSVTV
jgi:hypothetical protein